MAKNKRLHIPLTQQEIFGGWMILIIQQFALWEVISLVNTLLGYPLTGVWCNFLYHLITFIAVVIVFRTYLKKSLTHAGREFGQFIRAAILGFVALWAANYLTDLITDLFFSNFSTVNDQNITGLTGQGPVAMFIIVVILAPVAEETLFRGLLFQGLYNKNRVLAYIVSITLFALIHVIGYIGSASPLWLLVSFLQYLPAGLCLAWAYTEGNTIFVPILIHAVNNALAFL